ncbi:MAG: hypothetical protein IIC73_05170 [Armatimonadetes bacterium]|nr:hypothetical protein [Armatimonadota bacterium]
MPVANVRFVQFPHPGGEHRPDRDGRKPWNPASLSHARKFLALDGEWLSDGSRYAGQMWAWGEWEPESKMTRAFENTADERLPRYLWEPYYEPKDDYSGLHNTDPFVFGGFFYANCKQGATPSLEGLRHLEAGSVVVFGSSKSGEWVVDTVFVVRDFIDYTFDDYRSVLRGEVPDVYWDVTLTPTFTGVGNRETWFRLYRGATIDEPFADMFSFFPCMPAGGDQGFARPAIDLPPEHFNPRLLQGAKGHSTSGQSLDVAEARRLWSAIVEQVEQQGLALGVRADMPPSSTKIPT